MKLNCKQGDLAIIVSSTCGNEGKIVRCLELVLTNVIPDVNGVLREHVGGNKHTWRIDRPINFKSVATGNITQITYCPDDKMRPLRGDATDEEIETHKELSTVV